MPEEKFKAPSRMKPFHLRYLELCKSKNLHPLPEVKAKNKDVTVLDFYGDRVKCDDWMVIFHSLYYDTSLHYVAIKLRKNNSNVMENVTSIKKARKIHGPPVLLTNYIFTELVDTLSNFMSKNENLTTLMLEGLPLKENFITYIAKGLSNNTSIKNLSFARSALRDEGCEIVCSTIKYLPNIDCLNFAQCQIGPKGAESIGNLIKFQKIVRFTKGWENTLRYRTIDPDTIPGLKRITMNGNPITDEGLDFIMEVLKEDAWIKVLDLQNCVLTDEGAKIICDCLNFNNTLIVIDIHGNSGMSMEAMQQVKMRLGAETDESCSEKSEELVQSDVKTGSSILREKLKMLEQQLETEQFRVRQLEALNETLHSQLMEIKKKISNVETLPIPDGFTLIETQYLDRIMSERQKSVVQQPKYMSPERVIAKFQKMSKDKNPSRATATQSEILQSNGFVDQESGGSKSLCRLPRTDERPVRSPYIEKNIGDTCENVATERSDEDIIKIFMRQKKKLPNSSMMHHFSEGPDV
uniref:CSON006149 protein n=1 Tax=Culicoides sonorensis TaxID=179676 RepID=A0A336LZW6_CULSO